MTDDTETVQATRAVGNASGARMFIYEYGFLEAGADNVVVPDTDRVHELLACGALWTHEQAEPISAPEADADSAKTEQAETTGSGTTTNTRRRKSVKEDD